MSPQDYVRLGIGILVTIFAIYVTMRFFSSLKQNFSRKLKEGRTLYRVWWPLSSLPQAIYVGNSDIELVHKKSTIIDFNKIKSIVIQPLIVPPWINILLWVKRNDIIFSLPDGSFKTVFNMTENQTESILGLIKKNQPNIDVETRKSTMVALAGGLRFVADTQGD